MSLGQLLSQMQYGQQGLPWDNNPDFGMDPNSELYQRLHPAPAQNSMLGTPGINGGAPIQQLPDLTQVNTLLDQQTQAKKKAITDKSKAKTRSPLPRPGAIGLAILADLLLGKGKGHVLNSFLGGYGQGAQFQNQQDQSDADTQSQLDQVDAETAQQKIQVLLEQAKTQRDQTNSDRTYELQKGGMMTRADVAKQTGVDRAWTDYRNSNSPQEALSIGKRLQKVDPDNAPTDDELKARADEMTADRQKIGIAQWTEAQKGFQPSIYGEVKDTDAASLDPLKAQIEKEYGMTLPAVRTGKTALAKYREARVQQWKDARNDKLNQFKTIQASKDKDRAIHQGNLDLARQRFVYAQQTGNAGAARDQAKIALAQGKSFNQDVQHEINTITQEQTQILATLRNANTVGDLTPEQRKNAQDNYQALAERKDFLTKQIVPLKDFESVAPPTSTPVQFNPTAALPPVKAGHTRSGTRYRVHGG